MPRRVMGLMNPEAAEVRGTSYVMGIANNGFERAYYPHAPELVCMKVTLFPIHSFSPSAA